MLRSLLIGCSLVFLAAGCGPKVPDHDGYKVKQTKPWTKSKAVTLDEANEADIDGKVSWATRRRARWYSLTITDFGDLELAMRAEQIGGDGKSEFDLAFEFINPQGKVLILADKEEDDAGEEQKTRRIAELDPGTYWLHVYLQNRMQAASYNFRLKFTPVKAPDESTFPSEVPYVGKLAAVPPVDDAPPPVIARPKCKGKNCKTRPKQPPPPTTTAIRGRLTGVTARENGTVSIEIGIGSNRGVTKGSRGQVITAGGKAIQGGSFKVSKVTSTKSWATVKASLDAVNSAKNVRITPAP